jgi:predicted HicB family RNase H-like nuclease
VKRTVRLPPALAVKLEECAAQNGRSVNAEIVQRLRASLEGYRR